MALQKENSKITPEEYLEFEKTSEFKHEFFGDEIFAMVGAKKNHNLINSNLVRELSSNLKETPCLVLSSDQRIKVEAIGKYTYPDVSVVYEGAKFLEEELDSLTNPIVIIEILSESTEAYDRGTKFAHYQLIESLQEYILISQALYCIEKYKRSEGGTWIYSLAEGLNQTLVIESVVCEVAFSDIYHKINNEE